MRPLPVKEHVGLDVVGRLGGEAGFGELLINGHHRRKAAPLLRVLAVPFVGQETLEGHEQEGAELALLARRRLQVILLQAAARRSLASGPARRGGGRPCRRR